VASEGVGLGWFLGGLGGAVESNVFLDCEEGEGGGGEEGGVVVEVLNPTGSSFFLLVE
jgi:hypothetical protein